MWPKRYKRLQYIVKDAKRHSVWHEEGHREGEKESERERRCVIVKGLRKALMLREIRFAPKMATELEKKAKKEV